SAFAVRFEDQFNNPTAVAAPIAVSLGITPSGGGTTTGTLGGVTAVGTTNVAGFTPVSPNGTPLGGCAQTLPPCRTLVASASGMAANPRATSTAIHVVPVGGSTCTLASTGGCTSGTQNYNPGASQMLPAGVYNFATINIPAGVTVSSNGAG